MVCTKANVVLVFPPPWIPFQPYASLPYLAGALRKTGVGCLCIDAALDFYEYYLDAEVLSECHCRAARQRCAKPRKTDRRLDEIHLYAHDVASRCEAIPAILRGPQFFDPKFRSYALQLLNRSLSVIAAGFAGCKLGLDYAMGPWSTLNSRRLADAALSRTENPFTDVYRSRVLPAIERAEPLLVGISVAFSDQAFPALILAGMIRDRFPGVRLALGGPFLTANRDTIVDRAHPFFELVDHMIVGEGESAVVALARMVIGSCLRTDGKADESHCIEGSLVKGILEDVSALPTPAYDSLDLRRYFSPEPVLTLLTSRGCYWNQCEFCDIPGIGQRGSMRAQSAEAVMRQMDQLAGSTGCRCFALWDDAVPPTTLTRLAELLQARGAPYHWYAQVRADLPFNRSSCESLFQSGCKQLYMGVETGSGRLNARMNKRIDLHQTEQLLADLAEAGIIVSAGFFFGYPGETADDIEATLRFIVDHRDVVNVPARSVGTFSLRKGSLLCRHAAEAGLDITESPENDLAVDLHYHSLDGSHRQPHDLAVRIAGFLMELGLDEDRFGPHYLLYQVATGTSRPTFEGTAMDEKMATDFCLAPNLPWAQQDKRMVVYVPETARLARLGPQWMPWFRRTAAPHESKDALDFQRFVRGQPGVVQRKLLAAGVLRGHVPMDSCLPGQPPQVKKTISKGDLL